MTDPKPILFVGSSSEGKPYLEKIGGMLEGTVKYNAWNIDVFKPDFGNFLNDIIEGISSSNCALFIYTPDDKREFRDINDNIPRDNVVLETGIAIGILGKERVFIIARNDTALPKDFDGLTVFKFYPEKGTNSYEKSLDEQIEKLKNKIFELKKIIEKAPVKLSEYIPERIKNGVSNAKEILVVSPMLSSFLDNHQAELKQRLKNGSLKKLTVVLRDPNGNTLNLIVSHNNKNSEPKEVKKKITASISILQRLQYQFPSKIRINVIDHPFVSSNYVFDPESENRNICIQYNPFGDIGRLPQLYVENQTLFWNNFFIDQASEYLNKSKPYPAVYHSFVLNENCDFEEKQSLLNLWRAGYLKKFRGEKSALEKLIANTLIIIATDNNRLIGFSVIDKSSGKRRATVVDKKFRKQNIATDLVLKSLEIIPKQYSEVHTYSIGMQNVFKSLNFNTVKTKNEIQIILKRTDLIFQYDSRNDVLKYHRTTSRQTDYTTNKEWFILYRIMK